MITKEKLIETIQHLPTNFSMEEVYESLLLLEKIEKGLQDSTEGKVIAEIELDSHLPSWLV